MSWSGSGYTTTELCVRGLTASSGIVPVSWALCHEAITLDPDDTEAGVDDDTLEETETGVDEGTLEEMDAGVDGGALDETDAGVDGGALEETDVAAAVDGDTASAGG